MEGTGVGVGVGNGVGSGVGIYVGNGVGNGVGVCVGLPRSIIKRTSSQNPTELLAVLVVNFMPEPDLKAIVERALDDEVKKRLAILIRSLSYAMSSTWSSCGSSPRSVLTCSVFVPSARSCRVTVCATVPSPVLAALFGTQLFEALTDKSTPTYEVVSLGFQTAVSAPQSTPSQSGVVVGAAVEGTGVGVGVGNGVGCGVGMVVGNCVGTGVGLCVGLPRSISKLTASQNPTELLAVLILNFMPEPDLKAIVERALDDEVKKRLAILIRSLSYAMSSTWSSCGSSPRSVLTCSVFVPSARSCRVTVCATVPSPVLAALFGTQLFEALTDKSTPTYEVVSLGFQTAVSAPQRTLSNVVADVPSLRWTKTKAITNTTSRLRPAILPSLRRKASEDFLPVCYESCAVGRLTP